MNTRKFVLSDIHGCLQTFKALLSKITLTKKDKLYILGDLIDRGPDSKGVIDHIWKLQRDGYDIETTRGNHEHIMLNASQSEEWQENWMINGGGATLRSFNASKVTDIPITYFHHLVEMPYYREVDNYILVHAGLNFEFDNPLEDESDILWIREWYEDIDYDWLGERTIIHGHTPISKEEVVSLHSSLDTNQYLNIDTGCVFKGMKQGLGYLTCLELDTRTLTFQENIDF